MKWQKDRGHQEPAHEQNKNISRWQHLKNRIADIRRKMSRGAANIYRMAKSRSKWGNKHLWRRKDKGDRGRYGGSGE